MNKLRLIIGNLAIDTVVYERKDVPGGPTYFIVKELKNTGKFNIHVVSKLGPDFDAAFFPALSDVKMYQIPARFTTRVTIRKDEKGEDVGALLTYAGQITKEDVPDIKPEIVFVSTVLNDVEPEVLEKYKDSLIALDLQGFIRESTAVKWNRVPWENPREYLQYVDILKMSEYESQFLNVSYEDAFYLGVKAIVITHGKDGAELILPNKKYKIPSYATNVVSTLGAGDSFMTAFAEKYAETKNPLESLAFASREVACFLEQKEILKTTDDILKDITEVT